MDVNLDAFNRQLDDLIGRFADLGAKLGEAASELQDGGAPPAGALVEALAAARLEFVELRAEIVLATETLGIAVPDNVESAKSLEPVLATMAAALDAQRRRAAFAEARDRVVAVLDRIEGVRHQDDENFGPLVNVKLKAAELRNAALALPDGSADQLPALEANMQPFADLLTMLEATEALADHVLSALEQSVARVLGRQILVAVARHRLLLPGQVPRGRERQRAEPEPVGLADALRAPEPVRVALPEPTIAVSHESVQEPLDGMPPAPSEPSLESVREAEPPAEPVPEPEPPLEPVSEAEPPLESVPEPEPVPLAPVREAEPPLEPVGEAELPLELAPEPEPLFAAAPTPGASSDTSAADETAQWWLAAWARWTGWKNTLGFPDAVREELAKYPYLLSVPIQQSPEFEEGLLAYGYSIMLDHVEKEKPGCIGNALNNLKTGQTEPVGTQLYAYLVSEGRLMETYPDFVRHVLLAAVPEPGPWVQARIIHSKDDTRVFQRPTARLGETEQTARRFLADNQRFREHKFAGTLGPLTTRFFLIQAELKDAHRVETRLTVESAPSDSGLVLTVPAAGKATKIEVRRFSADHTPVPGVGRDYRAVWFAVFNVDPVRRMDFELGLTLRKDTRGMRK